MAVIEKILNQRASGGNATTDASELVSGILANARLGTGIPVEKLADGSISDEELQYLDGLTNDIVTLLAGKSDISHTHTKGDIGLGNVDNTSDANKPVSTAQQTALNLKANLASPTFTGTVNGITKSMVGLPNVDNTSDANKPVSTAQQTALNLKANSANPTFTGTVSGVTKTHVGLPNVPNTDATNASNIGSGILPDARLSANIRRSLVDSFPVDDNIIPSCVVGLAEVAKTYNLPGALTSAPSCIAKVVGLGAQSGQFTVRAEVTAADTVTVYYSYNDNSAGTIDIGEKTVYIENTKA